MPAIDMRVSCPNCATGYEVPEAALMGRTRTLRCSRCGMGWQAGFPFRTSLPKAEDEPEALPVSEAPPPLVSVPVPPPAPPIAAAPPPPPPPEPATFVPPQTAPVPAPVSWTPPVPEPSLWAAPPTEPEPEPSPIAWAPAPPPQPAPTLSWAPLPSPPEPEPAPIPWAPAPPPIDPPIQWAPAAAPEPENWTPLPPEPTRSPWATPPAARAEPPPISWAPPEPAPAPEPARWDPAPPAAPEPPFDSQRWTADPPPAPEPTRWDPAPEPKPTPWDTGDTANNTPETGGVRWPPLPDRLIEPEPDVTRWPEEPDAWSKSTESGNPFEEFAYEKKSKKPAFDPDARSRDSDWRTMPPEAAPNPRNLPFQDFEPEPHTTVPGFLSYDDDHNADVREKFSALVTLDQGKPLAREPEPPLYEGDANQQTIKIVLALLVVLIAVAGALVEHRLIVHFLPASAKFFNLLGLK